MIEFAFTLLLLSGAFCITCVGVFLILQTVIEFLELKHDRIQ